MTPLAHQVRTMNRELLRHAAASRGKRPLRRPPVQRWPAGEARDYYRRLKAALDRLQELIESRVIAQLPRILTNAQARRPAADGAHLDEYGDEITRLLEAVGAAFFGEFSPEAIFTLTQAVAWAVQQRNGREVTRIFKAVLGVDLFRSEPWLQAEMEAFAKSNVGLIKSVAQRHLSDVERIVFDAARRGIRHEVVAKELRQKPYTKSLSQVRLIARDQVGKFNGQLSELRQKDAGVNRYIWRTSRDARVRPSHRALEGQEISWSEPPSFGHPGHDYNCRCWPEPVLTDLFAEAGLEEVA